MILYKKKLCVFIVLLFMLVIPINAVCLADTVEKVVMDIETPSAVLIDFDTGTILYEKNADKKLPMASVTKIMTLLLCLESVESGLIKMDDMVTVSDYASSMGGSQIFLYPGENVPVSELLKAITVASANDASVAMAEKISGSNSLFIGEMNKRAKELGGINTNFMNCNGLPADNHYSTARDLALISRELLKHKDFFNWSTIWLEKLAQIRNNTEITNTNRMIRTYEGCDGIKTGSTNAAKYCLAVTAKRGRLRLISVLLAAPSSQLRFEEAAMLLDYGFANYDSKYLVRKNQMIADAIDLSVKNGREETVSGVAADDMPVLINKRDEAQIKSESMLEENLKAPIKKGDKIGRLKFVSNNKEIGAVDIIADRDVDAAKFGDYFGNLLREWSYTLKLKGK